MACVVVVCVAVEACVRYFNIYGIGYDARTGDYKVVGIDALNVLVVNLRNTIWHRIAYSDEDVPLPNYDEYDDDISLDSSFVLAVVSIFGTKNDVANLGVLDGFLTVCTQSTHHAGYSLWVMKEYGVVESWVKLFKFSDKVSVPLAYGRGSNSYAWVCELRKREGRLVWRSINRDKPSIGNEIHDAHGVGPLFEACVAKGSLVAISVGE
ncbi:F-box protein CPR1-like [Silene latifolia]|uniref:F-box protein CPR1-like n=1 Tax=Silene latifolia TaxID=37657 RepID=UPI003D771A76